MAVERSSGRVVVTETHVAPTDRAAWDEAYENGAFIPGASDYPPRWAREAQAFRNHLGALAELDIGYGDAPRERFDLFQPDGHPMGLVVFVHGGYWKAFDKSSWSHLAAGPLARGWAVAMPGYTLCPDARIAEITRQIGRAVTEAAGRVDGPIRLVGHSAGGHLVSRMGCLGAPIAADAQARIARIVSLSGLHDLRPLARTTMNDILRLDEAEARTESPALLDPLPSLDLFAWVGSDERPEFLRQNRLLATVWAGLAARLRAVEEPGRHHFDVIAGLEEVDSPLTEALCG